MLKINIFITTNLILRGFRVMNDGYVGAMVNGLLSLFFLWVVLIVLQIVAMCFVILDECLFPF